MVDTPDKIKQTVEKDIYERQNWDVSIRVRKAVTENIRHIELPYHLCSTLKKELNDKGYKVEEKDNWFFGEYTLVRW